MTPTKTTAPLQAFSLKAFCPGARSTLLSAWLSTWLGVCLGATLSACSPSTPEETLSPLERVYTVIFDKNGGDTEANPPSKTVIPPATTLDTLPEAPTREGHYFVGWNTQADGSGVPFAENTPVEDNLRVYAQWEAEATRLNMGMSPSTGILTPIIHEAYSERSTTFRVVVSGFENAADANKASLGIAPISGLHFEVESNPEGNTQNFEVSVEYDGQAAFAEGFATLHLSLANIAGYAAASSSTRINIVDGQAESRAIPLSQANMEAFNGYANTADGLTRHYRLTEDIHLDSSATNNWTPIGAAFSTPFSGSFNGEGHSLFGLRIDAFNGGHLGLFGYVGQGAEIQNLGLVDMSVGGRGHVGGLVGENRGRVRNCHAAGSANGNFYWVGCLVGSNSSPGTIEDSHATCNVTGYHYAGGLVGQSSGTVQNSYATGNISGNQHIGGLMGHNSSGTIENSHATGDITGDMWVGGLVGNNYGTLRSSYATGNIIGSSRVGGLAGISNGTVRSSYATGSVVGSDYIGGLVGWNNNIVQHCYATGSITGSVSVGGLAGHNGFSGSVQDSLALSPSLSGTTSVGRVVGSRENNALFSNHAFGGMLNSLNPAPWPNIGMHDNDGADINAATLQAEETFPQAFTLSPWTYAPGRLPGLWGQTVEMPSHLRP